MQVLIIGFGDVAQRLARALRSRPSSRFVRLLALVRRPETAALARSLGVTPVLGDLDDFSSLTSIAASAQNVIYFAPPPNTGTGDPRLRRALARLAVQAQRFVYVSTTGVYGDCQGDWVDETRPLHPESARATRRVDAERQLRRRYALRASRLRVPGIYASDRLPIERIVRGTPARIAEEDSYSNHIHADDLAQICWRALFRAKPQRAYNITDGSSLKMGQWFDLVADANQLPRVPKLPTAQLLQIISPELWSFMRESRRMGNRRLVEELRFVPRALDPHRS